MSSTVSSPDDVKSVIDDEHGGMWLLRNALDAERLGVTIVELEPGSKGKEHDHTNEGKRRCTWSSTEPSTSTSTTTR